MVFEILTQLEKVAGTSLAFNPLYKEIPPTYRGVKGEYVLSSQKEVDRYRVCSGDNSTEFSPWIGFVAVSNEPWRGFVAKDVDYTPTQNCTMFKFEFE